MTYPRQITVLALLMFCSLASRAMAQPGVYLPGAGAVHSGMGGVSTATPLDAIGAVYWNPAAVGRLGHNEVSIGGAFIYPDISVFSSQPRLDGTVISGRTRSDNGFPLLPSIGVVSKLDENSPLTFGFGLLSIGGGGVNFPGDANNPILSPTGPFGQFVIGPIFSSMQLLQLVPSISYEVTDKLVVGLGPTVDITIPSFEPAFFAPPNSIGGSPNTFTAATNARPYWGGGFRVGLVYSLTETIDLGFGYTSPQWLETWEFNARDNLGNAQRLSIDATLPAIYSWGAAWRGIDRLTVGTDMRYFDYENSDLFGDPISERGLGWKNAFVVALGGNYQLFERIAVRAGYQYNTNPLEDTRTLFNIQSPAIIQNTITLGTTVSLTDSMALSVGYAYGFENSISGSVAQIPSARVSLDAASHSLLFNLQVKFGGNCSRTICPPVYETAVSAAPIPSTPAITVGESAPSPQPIH
jgi:long-chain fatty acid transport protein